MIHAVTQRKQGFPFGNALQAFHTDLKSTDFVESRSHTDGQYGSFLTGTELMRSECDRAVKAFLWLFHNSPPPLFFPSHILSASPPFHTQLGLPQLNLLNLE